MTGELDFFPSISLFNLAGGRTTGRSIVVFPHFIGLFRWILLFFFYFFIFGSGAHSSGMQEEEGEDGPTSSGR